MGGGRSKKKELHPPSLQIPKRKRKDHETPPPTPTLTHHKNYKTKKIKRNPTNPPCPPLPQSLPGLLPCCKALLEFF